MEDLREREKAIEVLRNAAWLGTDADREQIEQAIEILANPDLSEYSDKLWKRAYERGKEEPQQRWVPCSERLPDEEVLCCDTRGEMIIGYPYQDEESNTGYGAVLDDVVMIECIAWMPLPKPYRAERRTDGV